jgi:hypothetical protein
MIDVAVGRLLVASLHQGISDLLPNRLEFYESWLNTAGLRDGRIGLAPLAAVLSFLRQEGEPYRLVAARAGEYAAEWTEAALPAFQRRIIQRAPPGIRMRLVMRVIRRLVHETYGGSSTRVRWGGGRGTLDIEGSIFCGVRDRTDQPLCGFYESAVRKLIAGYGLSATVSTSECRATGGGSRCVLLIEPARTSSSG